VCIIIIIIIINSCDPQTQAKSGDAVWMGSKDRNYSFHLWMYLSVAGNTVESVVNKRHTLAL